MRLLLQLVRILERDIYSLEQSKSQRCRQYQLHMLANIFIYAKCIHTWSFIE
jgi:hypothetical protein